MTPWLDDGDVQLYHGDVIQTLRELPAGIAQTCVTSPPYWGLRDYSADGQLGLEATPELYVERLVAVFREVWRVLRADGTVWLNLGDSYAGSWGAQSRDAERGGAGPSGMERASSSLSATQIAAHPRGQTNTGSIPAGSGLKPKDLVGVPWRVAFALQSDGWYLRSDIVWSKPNPMPESVVDRPTKAHEYLFLLAKQPRYYMDMDAIREPHNGLPSGNVNGKPNPAAVLGQGDTRHSIPWEPGEAGRNRRSVWTIPTEPFPEAHFATYPQALVRPCIQAGTSERGECSACGAPWVREVERGPTYPGAGWGEGRQSANEMINDGERRSNMNGSLHAAWKAEHPDKVIGWRASCACDAPTRPQLVLDPFIGSGTTALVARNHARRCIGIDLSAEYLAIAARRLQQLSLFSAEPAPPLERHRGLTGGAYSPPGQTPHSNARRGTA